ncbi:hypothetical protein [Paenibacillus roseipurpureus]|uniref:Uncharacterized protein n=1 Tax=Paenibacillus roseopurpureus TaxID=2918901 RepID=A0AA96RKH8_9BACL|nr:hypothetical protein [Paenibacillus sp. MBLB1832]WNR44359.1 hypothetical protein MJB10_25405 [Paenibacillus sp. MBLB1832]
MTRLIRWCGYFGVLGGLAYLPARFLIHPAYDGSVEGLVGWGLDMTAIICSLLLFTGILLCQWDKIGKVGLFSYFSTFILSAIFAGHQFGLILLAPVIYKIDPQFFSMNSVPPLSFLIPTIVNVFLKNVSLILFASLSIKYKVMPRWALIMLILGSVVDFAPMGDYIGRILFGIAFIGLGSALWQASAVRKQQVVETKTAGVTL